MIGVDMECIGLLIASCDGGRKENCLGLDSKLVRWSAGSGLTITCNDKRCAQFSSLRTSFYDFFLDRNFWLFWRSWRNFTVLSRSRRNLSHFVPYCTRSDKASVAFCRPLQTASIVALLVNLCVQDMQKCSAQGGYDRRSLSLSKRFTAGEQWIPRLKDTHDSE